MMLLRDFINWLFKKRVRGSGLVPQSLDPRDLVYRRSGGTYDSVDLRERFPLVVDQKTRNSCVAEAVSSMIDYYIEYNKTKKKWKNIKTSPCYLWYWSRYKEGNQEKNVGVILRNTFKIIKEHGFVTKKQWDWNQGFTNTPNAKTIIAGQMFKLYIDQIPKYYSLTNNNQLITKTHNCLTNEKPVVFGFPMCEEFIKLNKYNYYLGVSGKKFYGYHAMLIVGYNTEGDFIVRNSHGRKWGEKGHFILKKELFKEKSIDIWTLK